MNTTWNQWQTARFSVFARHSRVEINTQKDLEDMLAKLDENNTGEDEMRQQKSADADSRKRRFLELALPSGILAFLSVVYCLLFLADAGNEIVGATKMNKYLTTLEHLDLTEQYLIKEHHEKIIESDENKEPFSKACSDTDIALDELFTEKSLLVWNVLSDIRDWRNMGSKNIFQISKFYLRFKKSLKALVSSDSLHTTEVKNWKTHYEYQSQSDAVFGLGILFNVLEVANDTSEFGLDIFDGLVHFTAQYDSYLCTMEAKSTNRSIACSYDLFQTIRHIVTKLPSHTNNTVDVYDIKALMRLRDKLSQQAHEGMKTMQTTSRSSLTKGVIMILMSLLCIGTVASCIILFVIVFREQIRLVVLVSHWLKGVTTKVDEQMESTDKVVNQLVPRILVHKFDVSQPINMIPYQVSETTLFLISIAGFTEFFSTFASDQVLHILTLVMELLDERMEQYNVFPVSRMGQYLLVVSDSVAQKQVEHACEIANLALDIMTCCSDLEIGRHSTTKLQMKLAIHTGPCSGRLVIHNGSVQLKLTGNTLTVLQTLHKTAIPNMIQVSETTQKLLATCEMYCLRYRGNLKVPGMSKYYKVYWLNGRRVSSTYDRDSACSRMGSWIELEKRPLYRLVESEGVYEPLNKSAYKRYSQMSVGSLNHLSPRCSFSIDGVSNSSV